MSEYIKREDITAYPLRRGRCHENANEHFINGIESVMEYVEDLPAANVAPVWNARWIKNSFLSDDITTAGKCSACGEIISWFSKIPNYCPNCGAIMSKGD